MSRPSWDEYFLDLADTAATRSSCISRQVGAVIVKDNMVISTGYNGSPSGHMNCCDMGECVRRIAGAGPGERLDLCVACHAEVNAIGHSARLGVSVDGATIYITTKPCNDCAKVIISAGIKRVVYRESYPGSRSVETLRLSNIAIGQHERRVAND